MPIATNHCGQYEAIQIASPFCTGYQRSASRYTPRPAIMSSPCSMMWTSTNGSAAPGSESKNVDGQVERRLVGQQHMQPGARVAQEWLALNILFVADDANRRHHALPRHVALFEDVEPASLRGPQDAAIAGGKNAKPPAVKTR